MFVPQLKLYQEPGSFKNVLGADVTVSCIMQVYTAGAPRAIFLQIMVERCLEKIIHLSK